MPFDSSFNYIDTANVYSLYLKVKDADSWVGVRIWYFSVLARRSRSYQNQIVGQSNENLSFAADNLRNCDCPPILSRAPSLDKSVDFACICRDRVSLFDGSFLVMAKESHCGKSHAYKHCFLRGVLASREHLLGTVYGSGKVLELSLKDDLLRRRIVHTEKDQLGIDIPNPEGPKILDYQLATNFLHGRPYVLCSEGCHLRPLATRTLDCIWDPLDSHHRN